jgi:UPF0042 nucleotide-binding protein
MKRNELLILTGMSGAGRSTVAHSLEDLGWYVVDNLPPSLLPALAKQSSDGELPALAVVVDVRGGKFFDDLNSALANLKNSGIKFRLLFLDASDQSLVARFESTRRPHPLQGGDRISDGIDRERAKLHELRESADVVIDTSNLNVHQLAKRTSEIFAEGVDADLVLDCRFIPNPHWVAELRPLTGLDQAVSDRVFSNDGVTEFVGDYVKLIKDMLPGYIREGKKYLTIAIGCTGGKHRSVAISAEIAKQLSATGSELAVSAHAVHRDLGRE